MSHHVLQAHTLQGPGIPILQPLVLAWRIQQHWPAIVVEAIHSQASQEGRDRLKVRISHRRNHAGLTVVPAKVETALP